MRSIAPTGQSAFRARAWSFLTAVFLIVASADAQTIFSSKGEPYILDQWTVNEGLPQNTVSAVVQTFDGFLWLATNGGLVRFDGVRFHTFERISPTDDRAFRITSLVEGHDSTLWVGTEDGQLFRYRAEHFDLVSARQGAEPTLSILALAQDSSGVIWLGRMNAGLARVMGSSDGKDSVTQSSLQPTWQIPIVSTIKASSTGSLWIGGGGIAELKGSGIQTHELPELDAHDLVVSVTVDSAGHVWAGTSAGRLFELHQRKFVETPATRLRDSYAFDEVLFDGPPALINAMRSGVLRYLDGRFYRQGTERWGRAFMVRSVLTDREENTWIGTVSQGLFRIRRATFDHWDLDDPQRNVTAMVHDGRHGTWVGLNCGGVLLVRDGKVIPHPVSRLLSGQCVWSLTVDPRGRLWVGTWGAGLWRMDPDQPEATVRRWGASSGLRSDVIMALEPRRAGGLWVGTQNAGLAHLNGENVERWTTKEGLPSDDIRSFAEDSLGRLWIGTQLGPAVLEAGDVRRLAGPSGSNYAPVRTVMLDGAGSVWMGTYGGGLLRWKNGNLVRITTSDGLYDNIISQFLIGPNGYAWMGCNRGIWKVALQELNAVADGRIEQVTSITYGRGDGLRTIETNGGFQPAGLRHPNGELWFPTASGIARTNPTTLRPNRASPPVVVEQVFVDRVAQSVLPQMHFPAGVEEVRIEFTALSFTAPQKVRFKYQMVGYNKSWVDVGNERSATFTNVTPGTYRFRVIAANNDGVWNEDGAEITLTFEFPFWATLWFRLLAVLALVGMGMLVVAIRLRQVRLEKERQEETSRRLIQSQEEERQRIAGELHDGLGQDLIVSKNRLLLAAHYLQDGTPAKDELMNVVDAVTAALRSVRSIAYNLRPFQLDRLGLTETIRSTVRAIQQVTPVKIETEIASVDGLLNREAEIGVFRIVQEALTNVVKHSQATRASVVVAYDEGHIVIRVEDNGRGFDTPVEDNALTFGFGLSSIEERVKMLGGVHKFSSSPESGTTIAARVPIEGNEPEPAPEP